jgi:hypothetical protein
LGDSLIGRLAAWETRCLGDLLLGAWRLAAWRRRCLETSLLGDFAAWRLRCLETTVPGDLAAWRLAWNSELGTRMELGA